MSAEPYLLSLAARLQCGAARFEPERRARHRDFVLSFQRADGGFSGRAGDSDLYYTSFALRCLALLDELRADAVERIGRYLQRIAWQGLGTLDLVNWLYAALAVQLAGGPDPLADAPDDWPQRMAAALESVRTADGGYAKTPDGAAGSTYHSFLTAVTYELLGRPIPRPSALLQFVYDMQRDDGGFVEIAPMRRSGTNPTAAAVAVLSRFGRVDDELRSDVRDFLLDVYAAEGGFIANTRVPFADGLSTFTGLLTAQTLELDGLIDRQRMEAFVVGELELPGGGFRAAAWDDKADVEYTFYGLGTLALLRSRRSPTHLPPERRDA